MKDKMTPEERADLIERRRKSTRQFGQQTKKRGERMEGEVDFKKDIAVTLKIAGYSNSQIAEAIGETRRVINGWLSEEKVREKYLRLTEALSEAALTLLETYTIEAVQQLIVVMRTSEDPKFQLEAIREVLDRGGLPKASRSESQSEVKTKTEFGTDESWEALRHASPEVQEEAARLVEGLENLLKTVNKSG